ncbi:hypothetical protein KUTeg_015936 [Tegillarca granosa]|uniref:GAR domain-containing protein n=1 Tax=Tegillarca granosa TaxID=220873 RepID=A0ABQ9EJG1_TEGGR|nr:hypothetical protein KUTeg_015936 [Tegillarca granosa]
MWKELLDWLIDTEKIIDADTAVGTDPVKIKAQLAKHREFQRGLGTRQPLYDSINRAGRALKDKCPPDDVPEIQRMWNELKSRWNAVCGKSVDRQRKLEEALLFSGQFTEALQALLDWLAKVEPTLGEDQPVHGDIDTVNNLMESHSAEDFHKKGHSLLDWLSGAERQLRYRGAIPDEEEPLLKQIDEHKKFEEELLRQEANLRETLNIGQDIMKRCHPDAVSTMKHWLSVLRARWEEPQKPITEAEKINDEVKLQFGESQKLRLVRILRSTVMVRVGGGWVALDEFLVKNDPCRVNDDDKYELPINLELPYTDVGSTESCIQKQSKSDKSTGKSIWIDKYDYMYTLDQLN